MPDPPLGSYRLTHEIVLAVEESNEGWTLRIGDGEAHALVPDGSGVWTASDLGLTLESVPEGEEGALVLRRYGESVVIPGVDSGSLPDYEDMETLEVIRDLVPRLMIALDVPGVSVAAVRDRHVHSLLQFGVKTAGRPDRVDAGTVFEAASMSKPAYAYPFMKLVEEGLMELDRPLVEYLGRDYIEGEEFHRQITARMVLTHTTGFPNWRRDDELTVNFRPGSQIGYSGEGFQFLQTAAEAVTGLSTEEFAQQRLLRPLGMTASSYEWHPRYEETYATGHTGGGQPRERRPYESANTAYTLYTTPEDYARLLVQIMDPDLSGPHALQPETVAAMLTPELHAEERTPIDRGGDSQGEVHFALGWRLDRLPSGDRYWHSGSNSTGFQCYAEFDPRAGHGLVVMTNSSSGSPLWRALVRQIGDAGPG